MKKKLSPARKPLPRFSSDEETAAYFEAHSVADVWDELSPASPAQPSAALAKSIGQRHARLKSPISLRLAAEQIAAAKSVGYQTQLRMWIADGIRREAKRA